MALPKAKKVLKGTLVSTLAASGFIVAEKKKKKVKVDFGLGFRPGKTDPRDVVQRKTFRLGTRSEVKAITRAKPSKYKRGAKIPW